MAKYRPHSWEETDEDVSWSDTNPPQLDEIAMAIAKEIFDADELEFLLGQEKLVDDQSPKGVALSKDDLLPGPDIEKVRATVRIIG